MAIPTDSVNQTKCFIMVHCGKEKWLLGLLCLSLHYERSDLALFWQRFGSVGFFNTTGMADRTPA